MFNFFGTFTTGQYNEFTAFLAVQKADLKARKAWLSAQLDRNGHFSTDYDDATKLPMPFDPETGTGGFTCSPANSYGAKLLEAYRILGGVPEDDMLLRTSDDPVFLLSGTEDDPDDETSGYSTVYSNGRVDRGGTRFDRDLGLKVMRLKLPFLEVIKHKRERLEFKIKRALDYSDQLESEIASIDALLSDGPGSLDDLLSKVGSTMAEFGSFGVVDDEDDKYGLRIGRLADVTFDDASDEGNTGDERFPTT